MFPVTFDQCAGWLHPAGGARGVLICGSIGFESLCSHTALARLAGASAALGQPALRFDFHGCGDSAGCLDDPDRLATWKQNILAAAAFLRARTGVREIALVGLRLGASLAAEVLGDIEGLTHVALIAPPTSGKAYVRELKAMSRLIGGDAQAQPHGGLNVAGFGLSAMLMADVGALTGEVCVAPGLKILALGREPPVHHPLLAAFNAAGCDVTREVFAGYDAMMCDPTASQTPVAALARIAEWITADAATAGARLQKPVCARIGASHFTEQAVTLGARGDLAGVYCGPAQAAPRRALVIVNAGAIHHVGWARGSVDLARRLAGAGIASLRLNFSGVGDSFAAGEIAGDPLYVRTRKHDIIAAIDWLEAQGLREFGILGACSGAYQALQATLADNRISRVALVNQLCFVWGPAYALQLAAWRSTKSAVASNALAVEQHNAGEAARLLNAVLPHAKTLAKTAFSALTSLMAMAQNGFSSANVVEDWFETLSARGVRVAMVYSDDDPGLVELERWLGPHGARATRLPGVAKHMLGPADHMLTQIRAREALGNVALELFDVAAQGAQDAERAA